MTRPAILSAKVQKLAEIIADAEPGKGASASVADVRQAQADAAKEVMSKGGSVNEIEDIDLPTERVK